MRRPLLRRCEPHPNSGRSTRHSRPWRRARERPDVHPALARSSSAVVGTLHDPLAFVLRQGAQEGDEAATDGRGEIQVWLVKHLDHGTPCVDGSMDVHTIHHRPGGAVPAASP